MLHTRHILESIEEKEWFTIDLKDAYFHFTYMSGTLKVPMLCLPRTGLRVQSPPILPLPVSQGNYQGGGSCIDAPTEGRLKDHAVPGRLASLRSISPAGSAGHRDSPVPRSVSWLPGQLEEEQPPAKAADSLFRTPLQ